MEIRFKLTLLILVCFGISFLFLPTYGIDFSAPDIQFEEKEYDFGTIGQMEKVEHIFEFRNTVDTELLITEVDTSCDCAAALVTEKVIPPGGTGKVKVTFSSELRQGLQTKTIWVHSNDPDEPISTLRITALVKTGVIVVKPNFVSFGEVSVGTLVTERIKIYSKTETPLKITKVESESEYFDVTTREIKIENKPGYEIAVTINPHSPIGELEGELIIHTDDKKFPTIEIPIRADVVEK